MNKDTEVRKSTVSICPEIVSIDWPKWTITGEH